MGFFKQRKPRGFQHRWIYVDERKERLQKIEEKAKRELGMYSGEVDYNPEERIRGTFSGASKHLTRQKNRKKLSLPLLIVLIVALLFLLNYLLTGRLSF